MQNNEDRLDELLGEWLHRTRVNTGMTQTELGEALGIRFQNVQKYEYGKSRMPFARFLAFCDALGQDPCEAITEIISNFEGTITHSVPSRKRLEFIKLLEGFDDEMTEIASYYLRGIKRTVDKKESRGR